MNTKIKLLLLFLIGSNLVQGQVTMSGSIGGGLSKYHLKTDNQSQLVSDWTSSITLDFYAHKNVAEWLDISAGLGYSQLGDKWINTFESPFINVEYVRRKQHYVDVSLGPTFKTEKKWAFWLRPEFITSFLFGQHYQNFANNETFSKESFYQSYPKLDLRAALSLGAGKPINNSYQLFIKLKGFYGLSTVGDSRWGAVYDFNDVGKRYRKYWLTSFDRYPI